MTFYRTQYKMFKRCLDDLGRRYGDIRFNVPSRARVLRIAFCSSQMATPVRTLHKASLQGKIQSRYLTSVKKILRNKIFRNTKLFINNLKSTANSSVDAVNQFYGFTTAVT